MARTALLLLLPTAVLVPHPVLLLLCSAVLCQFSSNPVLVIPFMELFERYIKLNLLMEAFHDREVVVGMFGSARKVLTGARGDELDRCVFCVSWCAPARQWW